MKSLLKFLRGYYRETVLAPLFKLIEASFELMVPLVMAAIIDTGIANNDRPYIYKMCGVLLLLAAGGLAISVTAQYFAAKAATGFSRQLRHALFAHIQELSYSQIDQLGTDTLITRMTSDVNQAQTGVNLVLRLLLRSPFIVVGAMIMAFAVDVQAAVIFAVVIPVLGLVVFLIMRWTLPRYRTVQEKLDTVTRATRENLTGARVIRAFGREEHEIEAFRLNNDSFAALQQHVGAISGLMNPLTYLIVNLATAALIYTGAVRVDIGALTQGQVVALLNYMSQILVELIKMANLIIQTSRAIACGGRLAAILAIEPDMADGNRELRADALSSRYEIGAEAPTRPTGNSPSRNSRTGELRADALSSRYEIGAEAPTRPTGNSPSRNSRSEDLQADAGAVPAVEFRNVSLTYAGASGQALTDITFTANRGETIGIIGGTGSGKSSLVNLIPRFYDATKGAVFVYGQNVRDLKQDTLRGSIGVVPQRAELFKGTIAENLSWGKENPTEEEMQEALAAAQAKEYVDKKPGGTAFELEQYGRNLSGGQRQRMTIARALIRKPEILILDDSASALDLATDAKLRAAIREFSGNLTTFIVSQRAASVQYADRILVLDEGRLVGCGTHEELIKGCTVYQEIYYSQFPKEEAV